MLNGVPYSTFLVVLLIVTDGLVVVPVSSFVKIISMTFSRDLPVALITVVPV
jgi:hypothetical protein